MPSCLACGEEVDIAGATCSLVCYGRLYDYAQLGDGRLYLPDDAPDPLDLAEQPWYQSERANGNII